MATFKGTTTYYRPDSLLTVENAKTTKGESLGYLTGILYLAPANESGVMNVCPGATAGCMAACLYTAGRGRFDATKLARINKTKYLYADRSAFIDQLRSDIRSLQRKANRDGLIPAVRINGTSDLAWLATQMAREFPDVQFYDYTKLPKAWLRTTSNYAVTFSHSGENLKHCFDALDNGVNVSVVFDTRKGHPLPEAWNGYRVIDGDLHDLRFLDPRGVVVGLRAKGNAKNAASNPFVVLTEIA
jgi:hypothetical protein